VNFYSIFYTYSIKSSEVVEKEHRMQSRLKERKKS